jgi:hypothetical protein
MYIHEGQARIYIGARNRRYLSRKTAIASFAKQLMKKHCYCEFGKDMGGAAFLNTECRYHSHATRFKILKKLIKWMEGHGR